MRVTKIVRNTDRTGDDGVTETATLTLEDGSEVTVPYSEVREYARTGRYGPDKVDDDESDDGPTADESTVVDPSTLEVQTAEGVRDQGPAIQAPAEGDDDGDDD